jgi:hypothetical protein
MDIIYENDFERLMKTFKSRVIASLPEPPMFVDKFFQLRVYGSSYVTFYDGEYGIVDLIESDNQVVEVTVQDRLTAKCYRWVHPEYREERNRVIDTDYHTRVPDFLMYNETWFETETIDDIVHKIDVITRGLPYSSTVEIVLLFLEEDLNTFHSICEKHDITLDEFVEHAIEWALKEIKDEQSTYQQS